MAVSQQSKHIGPRKQTSHQHDGKDRPAQTKCQQCGYQHTGTPGQPCEVCRQALGSIAPVPALPQQDMAIPSPASSQVLCAEVPRSTEPTQEAHDPLPAGAASLLTTPDDTVLPPLPPEPSWKTPRPCAYDPCGSLFVPRNRRQRFHTLRCSALWRSVQPGGLRQMRAGHDRFFKTSSDFGASVVRHLAKLINTRTTQRALVTRLECQIALLEQFLALESAPREQEDPCQ